ncbi:crossover junction endodeoxyribonuclease RuvC [Candidatus Peregrinibacteria bacterium]|nr:crossover junction endodeoxyribonuclease RuvC [Candidatus Peregrinibacteria bacterium]MBI3816239.1 crossover junction endodeoxyribonuclease RuvC [Candidatus Peregrinibacteria bacterium]
MRILGIDPGIATIGLGVIDAASREDLRVIEWLTITTAAGTPFPDRLREIHTDLSEFLTDCAPDLAVVERLFFATNERTAIDVAHGRGVILLALSDAGIPVLEPSPLQLKAAITGDGKADKRQMQDMVMRMLKLAEIPRPDDAADALAMALYGALAARELIKN